MCATDSTQLAFLVISNEAKHLVCIVAYKPINYQGTMKLNRHNQELTSTSLLRRDSIVVLDLPLKDEWFHEEATARARSE